MPTFTLPIPIKVNTPTSHYWRLLCQLNISYTATVTDRPFDEHGIKITDMQVSGLSQITNEQLELACINNFLNRQI
jgi:hypothetical protein